MKDYSGLFGSQTATKASRYSDINPTTIDSKWATYQMIHKLGTETNQTPDQVYAMNYINSLNWLSYFKNVDDVTNNINKKQ